MPLCLPPCLEASGELAIFAARVFDMPLSFSFSYCFSFLTFADLLGMAGLLSGPSGTHMAMAHSSHAVLLDIDGTLVDSTYHHAIAWQRAFDSVDFPIPLWRIHRTVGMGGDKLVAQVAGDDVEERHGDDLRDRWREEYVEIKAEVVPLAGALEIASTS